MSITKPEPESCRVCTIILTHNEQANLPACLESLRELGCKVFIVDSGSGDRTVEIAREQGAEVVTHPFESHARQWNWALQNLPISTEWILALDADQRVSAKLRDEIAALLDNEETARGNVNGFYVKRKQIFRGKWIRHGGYYPKYLLKLFRRGQAWADENDLVDHHFVVRGETSKLKNDIIEDNRNEADISVWIDKHNRYATPQARQEFKRAQRKQELIQRGSLRGSPDERILWLKNIWCRLPLFIRPFLYFSYRYFLRLGFLDGKPGFVFPFLQAFWYRLLVDINLDDLRREAQTERTRESRAILEQRSCEIEEGGRVMRG